MDVTKRLFLALIISAFTFACSERSSSNSSFEKISGVNCDGMVVKNENILRWKNGKISRVKFRDSKARKTYLNKYKDRIVAVEDNFRIERPKPMGVDLLATGGGLNWGMKLINAEKLWNKNVLGTGVVVAIIDSGIDTRHAQLADQLYSNPAEILNGIDDDNNGLIDDIHGYDFTSQSGGLSDNTGHGTHVAGVIAADPSKGPVTGVAPKSQLLMYDFFGQNQDGTVFDAIRGIRAAVGAGAKVINASWGGPGCSSSLKAELDQLAAHDVLFIAAAGNEGRNIDSYPSFPAAFNTYTQITVGAMTYDEYTAGFSNYGKRVDLVAPGVGIVSTYPGNNYQYMDGTSMATPFVAGAAALLRSAFPQAKAIDIKNALISSAKAGFYPVKSRGSLDVEAAYAVLEKQFPPAAPVVP